jgi:hypothetical protein
MRIIKWESEHYDPLTNRTVRDDDDGDEMQFEDGEMEDRIPRLISNGAGVFQLDDSKHPLVNIDFWRGLTNFPITRQELKIINNCPGVELITYLSRYTFVIGIGRLFNFADVRLTLENLLTGKHQAELLIKSIHNKELQKKVIEIKDKISKEGDWTMYVFPNGNIEYTVDKGDREEYNTNVRQLVELAQLTNGIILDGNKVVQLELSE